VPGTLACEQHIWPVFERASAHWLKKFRAIPLQINQVSI
jgi:hypothetical protein